MDGHLQDLQSWGYNQSVYIGEYLQPIIIKDADGDPIPSESGFGRPGQFAYQIAAFTYGRITGGGIGPWGAWNAGAPITGMLKGMDGLIAERGTNKLTNLGYVCKLYVEATSVNNRPVASVLNVEDAKNTKIFATRRDNKAHILMGTFRKDPVINQLHINNAGNYDYKVTLWIIPFSTKNGQCAESDLIKAYSKTKSLFGDTLTIDVTDWSERESAKVDACYIELELIERPLYLSISGPNVVDANAGGTWEASPSGGTPPYQYDWELRESNNGSWGVWYDYKGYEYGGGTTVVFSKPNIDAIEWRLTVTDDNGNTRVATKYVSFRNDGTGIEPVSN